jgi:hypothetical protein
VPPKCPVEPRAVIVVGASRGRLMRQERLDHLSLSVGEQCSLGAERRGTRPGAILECWLCAEDAFGGPDSPSGSGRRRFGAPVSMWTTLTGRPSCVRRARPWRALRSLPPAPSAGSDRTHNPFFYEQLLRCYWRLGA